MSKATSLIRARTAPISFRWVEKSIVENGKLHPLSEAHNLAKDARSGMSDPQPAYPEPDTSCMDSALRHDLPPLDIQKVSIATALGKEDAPKTKETVILTAAELGLDDDSVDTHRGRAKERELQKDYLNAFCDPELSNKEGVVGDGQRVARCEGLAYHPLRR